MSYSNISDVLLEFNKDGSNHKSALALSNTSELEIKNLLKQIDTMIHHKKLRWERQKQDLDTRLQIKEQEYESQKTALEQKNVEGLKKLLENMESSTKEIMKKYEDEINILNQQLNKLKADYIKIQKKYKKNAKKSASEPDTPTPSRPLRETSREPLRPTALFNYTNECKTDHLNRLNLMRMNSSTSSTSTVAPGSHRTPDNQHRIPYSIVSNHEGYKLNAKADENKYKNADQENKSLEYYKRINKELLKKLEELTVSKNQTEANYNELKTNYLNADYYKQEIQKRDDYIRDLEALDKADNIELQFYKDEVKKLKKQELAYKTQIEKSKSEYDDAIKRLHQVETENKKLKHRIQVCEEKAKNDEILINNYEREKILFSQEISNLKNDILSLSTQLNDKNSLCKNITDKVANLEQMIKEKDENFSKTNQELLMTVAHVEALRLENHFLRQSLDEKKSDEKEVVEMQKKYHNVIDLTEKENKRLKNEIVSLSECIESLKSRTNTPSKFNKNLSTELENRRIKLQKEDYEKQIESLKKQHELSIKRLNTEIEKLYSEKCSLMAEIESNNHNNLNNKHLNNYNTHFNFQNNDKAKVINFSKTNRSNASSSMDSLSGGALSVSNQTTSLNHATTTTTTTTNNDELIKTTTTNNNNKLHRPYNLMRLEEQSLTRNVSSTNTSHTRFNTEFEPIEPSPAKSTRLSLVSQLQYDELKRKKDFENMLDIHIDSLRRSHASEHANNNFV